MKSKNSTLINIGISISLLALAIVTKPSYAKQKLIISNSLIMNLSEKLEKKRKDYHVPGMAIVIVKDDQVILSKGFGVSDIKNNSPVTKETLFGIGSTTKAFTANLIASLVDEGKMEWDDQITKYLPYLKFNLENEKDEITIRDMMSHQTGFTRFNLLYANGQVSRDDVLKAAINAEPWAGFREKFLYTNLMVSAAGVAAAKSINTNWEDLLDTRLLKPLGMKNTTARYDEVINNSLLSSGYMWHKSQNKHQKLKLHDVTNIGPAGAINSNVEDMANWLKMQLKGGKFNNKQLVSSSQIQQTWEPQIKIGNQAAYGLGWMMRDFRGQKMIVHDGSVEGFNSIVAMLPESNIGYVLLTNLTQTGLISESVGLVFSSLIEESKETNVKTKSEPQVYDNFIGQYMANFASFKNIPFDFSVKDGVAYLNVPGQTNYELLPPDKNGKLFFKVTNTVSVSFDKDNSGNVTALRMHQNGMDFELQKIGVPIVPEIDTQELLKYTGQYASNLFQGNLEVKIQNTRLAVDIPDQMVFELYLPDENNRRKFRIKDTMAIEFITDDKNEVISLIAYKGEVKLDTAKKIMDSKNEKLPQVEEILSIRNTEKLKKAILDNKGLRFTGTVHMKQSGIKGEYSTQTHGYDYFREDIDLGKYGMISTIINKNEAVIDTSFSDIKVQKDQYFEQIKNMHPAAMIDWEHFYDEIEVDSSTIYKNQKAYIIKLHDSNIPSKTVVINALNGDILKIESTVLEPTIGSIPVVSIFEDYKQVFGIRFPHRIKTSNDFNGESVIEIKTIDKAVPFNTSQFSIKTSHSNTGE